MFLSWKSQSQSVNTVCILRDLTFFYQGIIRDSFNNFTKINMIEYFNTACLFERFKVVLSWKCQGQSYEYQCRAPFYHLKVLVL